MIVNSALVVPQFECSDTGIGILLSYNTALMSLRCKYLLRITEYILRLFLTTIFHPSKVCWLLSLNFDILNPPISICNERREPKPLCFWYPQAFIENSCFSHSIRRADSVTDRKNPASFTCTSKFISLCSAIIWTTYPQCTQKYHRHNQFF